MGGLGEDESAKEENGKIGSVPRGSTALARIRPAHELLLVLGLEMEMAWVLAVRPAAGGTTTSSPSSSGAILCGLAGDAGGGADVRAGGPEVNESCGVA